MNGNGIEEFAMVIDVPAERLSEWERTLRRTIPPHGIHCDIRTASLVILAVIADTEFQAIDMAERWLHYLAQGALPPIPINLNPQPAEEV